MMDRSFHKVHVDECLEEVAVVVPHATEDVRFVNHVDLDEVPRRSGRGVAANTAQSGMGPPHDT
jgi:hypothetical protein